MTDPLTTDLDTRLSTLAGLLADTREQELDCDELLARVPAYLEALAASEVPAAAHVLIRQHLSVCPGCLEEFEALRDAMACAP